MRLWIVLALVACGKDAPARSPLVEASQRLVDKLCACKDATCATAIDVQWNELAKDQTTRQLSAEDVEALADLTNRYATCLSAARK